MKYAVLASGSKGNSTLIDNGKNVGLIDVGISKRELINKLSILGYNLNDIDFILITHEHQDHIKSINLFSKNKIYTSKKTYDEILNENELIPFENKKIKSFNVLPLPLSHDSNLCLGFKIETKGKSLVYILDTGYISEKILREIKNSDVYIIESNYDLEMLLNSKRPSYLKARIISDIGHLSNDDSCEVLLNTIGVKTKQIIFAHVSQDVNSKEKIIENFKFYFERKKEIIKDKEVFIADQKEIVEGII